jgi:hypothetical protein
MVNRQVPFFVPVHGVRPAVTVGEPQHFVTVGCAWAKGVTVTGTQMDAD